MQINYESIQEYKMSYLKYNMQKNYMFETHVFYCFQDDQIISRKLFYTNDP